MPLPENWREQLREQQAREREEGASFRYFSDWIKAHQPKSSSGYEEDRLGLPDFLKDGSFWEKFDQQYPSQNPEARLDLQNFAEKFDKPTKDFWWEEGEDQELQAIGQKANRSISENQAVASETLAQLLARQGKKNKAIRMYKALSLKFPEKSRYFAKRIKQLQQL